MVTDLVTETAKRLSMQRKLLILLGYILTPYKQIQNIEQPPHP